MSRFDDENDGDDFDSPEETDAVIRDLRAKVVRLEAQLDQLAATVRELRAESLTTAALKAEIEAAAKLLRARQRRNTKLLLVAWLMAVASLSLSLYTYFVG
ncbi:hypothetical protein R5W23_000340 [Gemmata sp. JC673]|uniref:DUF3618 domain-containing protein n=1 Tax=Gemmata algarum TaxID=2975278 RepID=A0ABU5EZX9_9BACT|nr:hypothetical protein [Gemmata algarum]MDY3559348.1 hypothetical protein [Gemmata algarum]